MIYTTLQLLLVKNHTQKMSVRHYVLPTPRHLGGICSELKLLRSEHLIWDLCNDFETACFNRMVLIHVLGSRKGSTHQSIIRTCYHRGLEGITKANHNFLAGRTSKLQKSSSLPKKRRKLNHPTTIPASNSMLFKVIALPCPFSKLRFSRKEKLQSFTIATTYIIKIHQGLLNWLRFFFVPCDFMQQKMAQNTEVPPGAVASVPHLTPHAHEGETPENFGSPKRDRLT